MRPVRTHRIGVIPGDGTGPEVIDEGLKVLHAVSDGFALEPVVYDIGGDQYLRTGETLPNTMLDELREVDAMYLGAVGHPQVPPGILERELILRIRFELDQYINLQPVRLYLGVRSPVSGLRPEDVEFVFENSEGLYAGTGWFEHRGGTDERAIQERVNSRLVVERCLLFAFDLARGPGRRGHVTLVHKTDFLNYAGDLWRQTFEDVAAANPGVDTAYLHVDAACIFLIEDPGRFDLIVTDNIFGDILTDLAAVVQGGMGVAAGGNLHPGGVSIFEPIGGTAPDHVGQGTIHPLATIGAAALMLAALGEQETAARIEGAIREVAPRMRSMRAGEIGFTTGEVGDMVAEAAASPVAAAVRSQEERRP
jgi:3-isopropylmalate dehydrogenase